MSPRFPFCSPSFLIGFGKACLLFIGFLFITPANAQVRSKLQWFDAHGEIIDLDWGTSVQWTWSQERVPIAQVIINIPEQLHLITNDQAQAKFMNAIPDRDGKVTNRTLVVEMEGPRKTIKLKKVDSPSESKEIGLTITLAADSPNVIPSESCIKEGISIEPRQAEANFIFLAASCRKLPAGLRISVETSNDALLGKDDDDQLKAHSSLNPLIIFIPKKIVDALRADTVVATVRAESQTTPPMTTQFELIYTKESPTKIEAIRGSKATALAHGPDNAESTPWSFTSELGMGFLGYVKRPTKVGSNPSEYNLIGKLTAEHPLFNSRTHLKADAEIPLFTLMPNARFPASGFYKATARAALTIFDRGKIAFHMEPGLEIGGAKFRGRSDVGGMYLGPVLAAYLNGTVGALNNRAMSALFSVAPLAGRGLSPTFHSWDITTQLTTEFIKGDAEKRWDLVLRFNYLNLHAPSLADARSTEMILGIRTGF